MRPVLIVVLVAAVLGVVGTIAGVALTVGLPGTGSPAPPAPTAGQSADLAPADEAPPAIEQQTAAAPGASPSCVPASLAERAGQVLMVGLPGVTDPADPLAVELADLRVGGVLLTKTNVEAADQVRALVAGLDAGSQVPLLISTDEEPGRVSSFGTLIGRSSSARTLAEQGGPEDVRAFARELGGQLAGFGVDLDLAPVADLDQGPAGGIIGDRSFSAEPEEAGEYALAFARGLADAAVLPTVKHFPGHGRSATDSHLALDTVEADLGELAGADLAPFQAAIDAGAPVMMLSHVGYSALDPDLPASLSPKAYTLLRDMGFTGVAMTDSLGMGAVNTTWPFPEAAVLAVTAGADALLATDGAQARSMRDALVAAVGSGRLPETRLNEAAARVLALKGLDPMTMTCTAVAVPRLTR